MKLNKITSLFFGAALCAGFAACTDEVSYNPAPKYAGDEVFFPADDITSIAIEEDATNINIPIVRLKADGAILVGITSTVVDAEGNDVSDIFQVPTEVTFAAGESTAQIPVSVMFSSVVAEANYYLTISIDGDAASPYGLTVNKYTLSYQPWGEWERVGGNSEFGYFTVKAFGIGTDNEVAVYKCHSLVSPKTKYQFGDYDCPALNSDKNQWSWVVNGYNFTVSVDDELDSYNTNPCFLEPVATGDDESFGSMLYMTDMYTYFTQINPGYWPTYSGGKYNIEDFYNASYLDPETGLFEFFAVYYTDEKMQGSMTEYAQLPGFAEYFVEFEQLGNFVNKQGDEITVMSITKSPDVNSYAYTVVNGALTDETAEAAYAALQADADATLYYDDTQTITLALEEGKYTILAVGYDADLKRVCGNYLTFSYESVQKSDPFETIGTALYSDGFLYPFYGGNIGGETWDVEIQRGTEDPNLIRMVNPYNSANWPTGREAWDLEGKYYITLNIADPKQVYIYDSPLGIMLSSQDGEITVASRACWLIENGNAPADVAAAGYCGTLKDGIITFPAMTLLINWSAEPDSWSYTNMNMGLWNMGIKDPAVQIKTKGQFELDLSDIDGFMAAPAKKASAKKVSAKKDAPATANKADLGATLKAKRAIKATKISAKDVFKMQSLSQPKCSPRK